MTHKPLKLWPDGINPACKATTSWALKAERERAPRRVTCRLFRFVWSNLRSTWKPQKNPREVLSAQIIILVYETRCQGDHYDAKITAGLPSRLIWGPFVSLPSKAGIITSTPSHSSGIYVCSGGFKFHPHMCTVNILTTESSPPAHKSCQEQL